ncbi:MAG: hypothetical protein CBD16_08110 [Betaproteobacteria bacterium TMED156]|nr:MAG: hypothetical protein CBD16_08110 [Betaproteobacteria bacterium TMED156]
MKITKKNLEKLIIKEITKILQEQEQPSELDMDVTPGLRPEGYQNLHRRLLALEKAAKSAGWELGLKPTKNTKNTKNDSAPDWRKLGYKSEKAYHLDMIMGVATRGKVPEWKRLGYKSEAEFNADTDSDFVGLLDDWDDDIDDRSDEDID